MFGKTDRVKEHVVETVNMQRDSVMRTCSLSLLTIPFSTTDCENTCLPCRFSGSGLCRTSWASVGWHRLLRGNCRG
jgi:hypothetical protein